MPWTDQEASGMGQRQPDRKAITRGKNRKKGLGHPAAAVRRAAGLLRRRQGKRGCVEGPPKVAAAAPPESLEATREATGLFFFFVDEGDLYASACFFFCR